APVEAEDDQDDDPEIPRDTSARGMSNGSVTAERMLGALSNVRDSLQLLNHNTMALHISGKRVIEACDVCDLRGLWLCISQIHAAPNSLTSIPGGSVASSSTAAASASANVSSPVRHSGYRRSSSLPQLRRIAHIAAGSSPAFASSGKGSSSTYGSAPRLRADTIDTSESMPAHLTRRIDKDALADSSDNDDESPGRTQALREARAKDKLNRFFGDNPTQHSHPKRPMHIEDISITPVSSHQLAASLRTPTRSASGYVDDPSGGPATVMNSGQSIRSGRSSTTPSSKGQPNANANAMSPALNDQIPWYLNYDSLPEEMLLTADGQVKGSTLSALVERLV
ncbi:hypothetical protein GGI23_007852, partial [Coemansia sp. RSA 2559]